MSGETARERIEAWMLATWSGLTAEGSEHGQLIASEIHCAWVDVDADAPEVLSLFDLAEVLGVSLPAKAGRSGIEGKPE